MELLTPGTLVLPAMVGLGLLLGFLVETLLIQRASTWYYAAGLPLGRTPVPFPPADVHRQSGVHAGLRYRRVAPGVVAFWADRADRRLPAMLHGVAFERAMGPQVALDVRWAPPFTPLLGATWLIVLGLARGEAPLTVPIGLLLIAAVAVVYHRGAVQACRTLRFALQHAPTDG